MSQPFRDATNRAATPTSNLMKSMAELSITKTPSSASRRANVSAGFFNNTSKTPNNSLHASLSFAGRANNQHAQVRGLRRRDITPSRNVNFNGVGGGDRFIPNRSNSQFELGNFQITSRSQGSDIFNTSHSAPSSPAKDPQREAFKRLLRGQSAVNVADDDTNNIFVYRKDSAPAPPIGFAQQPKVLYTAGSLQPSSSVKKNTRHIPTAPAKLLDSPEFLRDFYANLVDWSREGLVAVALMTQLYLWSHETGEIQLLFELDASDPMNVIHSVRWADSKYLAVGFADGTLRLYDPSRPCDPARERSELRKLTIPWVSRADSMAWNGHILSSGHKSGQIFHHDVRISRSCIGTWNGHSFEVCGLEWSEDKKHCASGGGDDVVNVWTDSMIATNTSSEGPDSLYRLNEHTGNVKAVQFCPYKSTCLATGGGKCDRTVKLWDLNTGTLDKTIDTGAQVTGIRFSKFYKEMITSHGEPSNSLKIWKHPTYNEVATLTSHSDAIYGLAMSPCGEYVMSAGADEVLSLWHCFKVDASSVKARSKMDFLSVR